MPDTESRTAPQPRDGDHGNAVMVIYGRAMEIKEIVANERYDAGSSIKRAYLDLAMQYVDRALDLITKGQAGYISEATTYLTKAACMYGHAGGNL